MATVRLANFGIEVRVPLERTDAENIKALDEIEEEVRADLLQIAEKIKARIPGAEVKEDRQ
jgi:hypothetical protein